jgi:hypothetical protein
MNLSGRNIIVIDLATAKSAEDCRYCGASTSPIPSARPCKDSASGLQLRCLPIGWDNSYTLGVSLGCYWDYLDQQFHWFDTATLASTMQLLVERKPLMVTFNGIAGTFRLMRAAVEREAQELGSSIPYVLRSRYLRDLCEQFKWQCESSYDLLRQIRHGSEAVRLRSISTGLRTLVRLNDLKPVAIRCAEAPRLWQAGQHEELRQLLMDVLGQIGSLFTLAISGLPIVYSKSQTVVLPIGELLARIGA